MKLYIAAGVYVGTQAEAKALDKHFAQVEVPTDKEGLIGYLNEISGERDTDLPLTEGYVVSDDEMAYHIRAGTVVDDASDLLGAEGDDDASDLLAPEETAATVQLSRIDNPGINVDSVVETIMKAGGYALKRYSGAVAVAFEALSKR